MGTINKVCAFTGHRPGKLPWRYDETDSRCVALKAVLAGQITLRSLVFALHYADYGAILL